MNRLLGAHMSIAGGVDKAIERGQSIGCTAIQIFVKNNNQWFGKPISPEESQSFIASKDHSNIFVLAHAGYLINLAHPAPGKTMESMLDELQRCDQLNIPFIVLHPGSHLGSGEGIGLGNVAANLNRLFDQTAGSKVKIALETTSGQGTNLGYKFEHLREIIDQVDDQERIGVCFDTCHSFAAGYDLRDKEGYRRTMKEFEEIIGLDRLMAFHLNDSKGGLGSHKDRHEHIGKGLIGLEAFRLLMNDRRFIKLPMVLETPKEPDLKEDIINLRTLRDLCALVP